MLMNEHPSRPYRSLLLLLLAVTAACSSALGIDEAHLDPTFNAKSDQKTLNPTKGGVCKSFDNQARLANLLPDGGLMPLPSR
jgi:hypothetical protein